MKTKKGFINLKAKIMISVLVPIAVSFVLINSVIFLTMFNTLRKTAESEFSQVSQQYAHTFENKINSAMNYLSILSSELEAKVKNNAVDRVALRETVFEIFEQYGLIDGSSVYFEPDKFDGRDAEYTGTEFGSDISGRICWYFYKDSGETAYLPEGLPDEVEFTLPHYTMAKQANKPIYTDPVVYDIEGKNIPMFTLTHPINNAAGEFIGAVTVDVFLDEIYSLLQSEKLYETGYVIIANDNEQLIYSPRYNDIGKTRAEAGLDYLLPDDDLEITYTDAKSILNGKRSLITINSVYIPQLDSKFYVSATAPLDEINREGIRLIGLLALFGTSVLTLIALLVYFLINKLSAPLNEITEKIDRIANGDYNARIEGLYSGEFGVVKDSVNTMADSIEDYIKECDNSINVLKAILNGLDAVIYVTVPGTGEILFVNESMKKLFDMKSSGEGLLCYKVFQENMDGICEFCPCHTLDKLPDGEAYVWEENNPITKRIYRNTDRYIEWIGGVKAHLQHSVDITEMKNTQLALDRRLRQQALMTTISQSFLTGADIRTLIKNALNMTGEFMDVPQILFYELQDDGETMLCTGEWMDKKAGLKSRIDTKHVLREPLTSMAGNISRGQKIYFSSNDPKMKAVMKPYRESFTCYITVPIFLEGKLYGALDISRSDNGVDWSESDLNLAVLVANLLSGVIEKGEMEGRLRRLSSIVQQSPQLILYVASDGRIDYVNPAAVAITGYTEEEILERGFAAIFDSETERAIKEKYLPETLKNGTGNYELNLLRKDGEMRIVKISSFVTESDGANLSGIVTDITEIRKLEADLIAAKELAEQGSRSKSEFLSRMSHEMRTPMNAVIGMTSIAKNSSDPEKKEYCLEKIDNASRHLLGVINDILDMSKIEADKFELSYSEFSFERMLRRVMDVLNFKIDEKKQEFSLYVDPAIPPSLICDEQRLAQVITNLLSNAVKFTPENGRIDLKVTVEDNRDGLYSIKTVVTDSGIGISEEQQKKLFRSFEQADGSIARKFGGTGLGLAISKRIIELMGGEIWVESHLGEGSKFSFVFTAEEGTDNSDDLQNIGVNFKDLKVLVVDDSPEVLEYCAHVMAEIGINCKTCSDGGEAYDLITKRGESFDLVFIDWKMPVMNGIELTKKLRETAEINPIIIMISVAEWSDIENEATGAGVNGFVSKPLFPTALADCINKFMGACAHKEPDKKTDDGLTPDFEGKTALLAEDVEINREIVLTVLEGTKMKIDCAENGREAVELFEADPQKYDIIFMDMHMPEVDGLEATRRIRASSAAEGARIPIIAMTANVFREDIEKCREAGMDEHIGKPIDFKELFEMLGRFL